MHVNKDSPVYDLALRLSGLALVVFGAVAILQLYHLVHVPPRHEATLAEMGLAAIGFLGCSLGGGLISLGAHIHDQVLISSRWARAATTDDAPFHSMRDETHSPPLNSGSQTASLRDEQ